MGEDQARVATQGTHGHLQVIIHPLHVFQGSREVTSRQRRR